MFSFFKKRTAPAETKEENVYFPDDNFDDPGAIFERFTNITGMNFSSKEEITKQKIKNFCMRYEIHGFGELNKKLEEDDSLLQSLIDYLTVNETYFFRELEQIEILKEQLKAESKPIRILCAPCATGEEVYSIIIQFLERDIRDMSQATGGSIHYFRNRIRKSFTEPQVRAIRISHDGKDMDAVEVVVTPFTRDPNVAKFERYAQKRYEFIMCDGVPGGLYRIHTLVPAGDEIQVEEQLTFSRVSDAG